MRNRMLTWTASGISDEMRGMRHRAPHLGRRTFALLLAYLLALQVILTAWAVVAPSAASSVAQAAVCATNGEGGMPSSGGTPAACPCGPMCASGGCAGTGGPVPTLASTVVFETVWSVARPPFEDALLPRRVASEPERARAPPVLA